MTENDYIVSMVFGSHLYGLDTPESDTDVKGIFLPTVKELLLDNYKHSVSLSSGPDHVKNSKYDTDIDFMSLHRFIKLATAGEIVPLDMLHAEDVSRGRHHGYIWDSLRTCRDKFYSKNLKAFNGYIKRQLNRYGVKDSISYNVNEVLTILEMQDRRARLEDVVHMLPTTDHTYIDDVENDQTYYVINGKKYRLNMDVARLVTVLKKATKNFKATQAMLATNTGIDWKACSHALRVGFQAYHLYKDGEFTYPLDSNKFLMDVKLGNLNYKNLVEPAMEDLIAEVTYLARNSNFPEKVDMEYWDEWLVNTYMTAHDMH